MISRHGKNIRYIDIKFDKNFINSLSILSKRKIDALTVSINNKDIIIGIRCPVSMNEDTFEQDKNIIESDILQAFTNLLNSEICNVSDQIQIPDQILQIPNQINKRNIQNTSLCPLCGSTDTIGNGHRSTKIGLKEKRFCRQCGKHYTNQEDTIWKMKNRRRVIEDALKLSEYHSLRDTADLIKEKYKIEISHSAIYHWRKNKRLLEGLNS